MGAIEQILAIAADRELVVAHPADVLAEANVLAADPGIDDSALVDLTHLAFVTIDEEQSKDLDQALCFEQHDEGYVVWYAIADAAYYVRPGSAIHAEALRRGSTYYLPGLIVPMLPPVLSEDIVSLNEDVERRALVFKVNLDASGMVLGTEIVRGRVRSRLKTWYDAVQDWYDGGEMLSPTDEVAHTLRLLMEVGEKRIDAAEARSVVIYRRAAMSVHLGGDERRFVALADPRNACELYNEQISLLCNMEGARLLRESSNPRVQGVYRTHEAPAGSRLSALVGQIDALIRVHRLDAVLWRWDPATTSLCRYMQRLPIGRVAAAIHRQAMMSSGSASFGPLASGHFGVGADEYARFTAPMREMVGIFTHKECWEMLGEASQPDVADERLREAVISAALSARHMQRAVDREINRVVIDQLFADDQALAVADRPGHLATVMGIGRNKVHVRLDQPPIDVKLYHRHLEKHMGKELVTSRDSVALRERKGGAAVVLVGDAVAVRVLGHDVEADRWELGLAPVP